MDQRVITTRLQNQLVTVESEMLLKFNQITAEVAAKGSLISGSHLVMKGEAVSEAVRTLVSSGLSDIDAVERQGGDVEAYYGQLRTSAIQLELRGLEHIFKKAEGWATGSATKALRGQVHTRTKAALAPIDDHRNGFDRSTLAAGGTTYSVSNSPGAVVQAQSPGASASTQVAIKIEQVSEAVSAVAAAVAMLADDVPERSDLQAEIDTMRSQLRKKAPNQLILRESAKTLRSLAENVVASAITPSLLIAAQALWTLLT